jgi:cytochrome oxidase Cu insertion factor (SCO1/SenC/PrrC family)
LIPSKEESIMTRLMLLAISFAVGSGLAMAADPAPEKTGIKVGETAPEFTLKDQSGTEQSLKALRKEHIVALVFYRSAGW